MKKIKFTALFLIGFSALLFAIAVIINTSAFDEELLPEVKAIKNIPAKPFAASDAYPAILAITGPIDKSYQALTSEVRDVLNNKIKETGLDYLSDDELEKLVGSGQQIAWPKAYTSCNSRIDSLCMEKLFSEVEKMPISDEDQLSLLARYQDLILMTDYSDMTQLDFDAPLPAFSPVLNLKKLFLANSYSQNGMPVFVDKTLQDFSFWRMILKEGHLLITKMVAVSSIRMDLAALSTAIRQKRFSADQSRIIAKQLAPFTPEGSDMGTTFKYEFKYGVAWFGDAKNTQEAGLNEWFDFYQPNATLNWSFSNTIKPLINISKLDSKSYFQYINSKKFTEDFPQFSWGPGAMYNPTGKILVGVAAPAYSDYIGRIHDLNGMISLLQLQIELALNPELPAPKVISQSKWVNPYTLKPMSYDAETKRIYFECMDKTSKCELLL